MTQRFFGFASKAATLVLCVASMLWAAQAPKFDVSGVWTFSVQSEAGASTPTVTLKQDGEKLTGHYSSLLVGEAELTGTVKGQNIEFTVSADVQGTKFQLKYSGTVENKDSMKGELAAAEFGAGTFTAKRKQ
jgi:hypothetical protein